MWIKKQQQKTNKHPLPNKLNPQQNKQTTTKEHTLNELIKSKHLPLAKSKTKSQANRTPDLKTFEEFFAVCSLSYCSFYFLIMFAVLTISVPDEFEEEFILIFLIYFLKVSQISFHIVLCFESARTFNIIELLEAWLSISSSFL